MQQYIKDYFSIVDVTDNEVEQWLKGACKARRITGFSLSKIIWNVWSELRRVSQLPLDLKEINVQIENKEFSKSVLNVLPKPFKSPIVALCALAS